MNELSIKSKFLLFELDKDDDFIYVYNKRFNDLVGSINASYHFIPEKNTRWSERDLKDILKAIEYLKKIDKI